MKKLTILTSVLALAACGGGSGGGSGANTFSPTPAVRIGTVTQNAIESNTVITGMVSEIGESTTDNSTINVGRSATSNRFSHNGKEYISHKLDEARFIFADHSFGDEMKFTINEETGEINGIDFIEGDQGHYDKEAIEIIKDGDIITKINLLYDDKSFEPEDVDFEYDEHGEITGINVKSKPQHYTRAEYDSQNPEESKKFVGSAWDQNTNSVVDTFFVYDSMGKDIGLKYSDFGIQEDNVLGNIPFMGGYDIKKINVNEIENITTDNEFHGKATGHVIASQTGGQDSGRRIELEGDATLTFDPTNNNTTTMTASFNNWYDVTYTENSDGKNIALTNYTFNAENHYQNYEQDGVDDNSFKMISENPTFNGTELESEIRYFGDNNTPDEAVGLIQIRDCGGIACGSNDGFEESPEVRMNVGFGVKAD